MVRNAINKVKNAFVREQNEVLSAAALLMVIGLVTKIFGMVLYSFIAKEFGTNIELEFFNLASVLPDTITSIILAGAISSSIIPIFSKVYSQDEEHEFSKSFSNVFNSIMLLFGVLALLAAIFAKEIIPLAINVSQSKIAFTPQQVEEVILMMRVMLFAQILLGVGAFFSAWLNIKQRFVIPQLAPLFYNFGKIFGILVFVPMLGGSIWGLVWGMLLGAIFHLLVQLPVLKMLRFQWHFAYINRSDKNLIDAFRLGIPRMLSLAVEYVGVIVDSLIALSYASLSVYGYAVRLISLPLSLGGSFAVAAFPSLSKLKQAGKTEEFSKLLLRIINETLYLTLPIAVALIVLRVPIVRLIFGLFGGEFKWDSTLRVSWVVLFFALGISFEALRPIMFKAFFSTKDRVTTFFSSIMVLTGGITTGILFSNYFSHFNGDLLSQFSLDYTYFLTRGDGDYAAAGLALSSSLIFSLEFFFLITVLKKKGHLVGLKKFFKGLLIKLAIAFVMLVVCYVLAKFWEEILNTAKTVQLFFLTGTTLLASFSIYLLLSYIFSVEEVRIFLKLLNKILKLFRIKVEENK